MKHPVGARQTGQCSASWMRDPSQICAGSSVPSRRVCHYAIRRERSSVRCVSELVDFRDSLMTYARHGDERRALRPNPPPRRAAAGVCHRGGRRRRRAAAVGATRRVHARGLRDRTAARRRLRPRRHRARGSAGRGTRLRRGPRVVLRDVLRPPLRVPGDGDTGPGAHGDDRRGHPGGIAGELASPLGPRASTIALWTLYLLGYVPAVVVPLLLDRRPRGPCCRSRLALVAGMAVLVAHRAGCAPVPGPGAVISRSRPSRGCSIGLELGCPRSYIAASVRRAFAARAGGRLHDARAVLRGAGRSRREAGTSSPGLPTSINPMLMALGVARRRAGLVRARRSSDSC